MTVLANLHSLLAFACVMLAAWGIGRTVLRRMRIGEHGHLERVAWSLGVGLTIGGTLLAMLGLLGWLSGALIGVLTLLGCAWAIGVLYRDALTWPRWDHWHDPESDEADGAPTFTEQRQAPSGWLVGGLTLLAGLACVGSLIAALAPPTAGDALCYHLELPKAFLAHGRITFLPYQDGATFPLLVQMWYLWAMALDGPVAAQLVHWSMGPMLAAATTLLARPILGRPWATVAGLLVLMVPGVTNQMTAPLNDAALAAMTTLTLAAWYRGAVEERSAKWFIVAGLLAGAALATKYLAILFALAVAAQAAWLVWRRPHQRAVVLRGALLVALIATSVAGLWYVRAAWYRGNPVYPFLAEVFPSKQTDPILIPKTVRESKQPLGNSVTGLMTLPWQLTMHPESFGGRGHQLGILPLAFLPGLLLCRRLRGLGFLLTIGGVYLLLWFLVRQNARFLMPLVPLAMIPIAWVWHEMRAWPRRPRVVLTGTAVAILLVMALVPWSRSRHCLAVATGFESRDDYLLRHEPTYAAAMAVNRVLPDDATVLSLDYRTFYFQRPVVRENVFRRETHYLAESGSVFDILQRHGITHLLLVENRAERGIRYDRTLPNLIDSQHRDQPGAVTRLTRYTYHDIDGAERHYRLLALDGPRSRPAIAQGETDRTIRR